MLKRCKIVGAMKLSYLVKIDEIGMENRDIVLWSMADLTKLVDKFWLIIRIEDFVTLENETGPNNVLHLTPTLGTFLWSKMIYEFKCVTFGYSWNKPDC